MKKCVLVLDGISEGKTKFTELVKTKTTEFPEGVWTWSINASNVLSVASRSMGWDGVKDDRYYEYLTQLMSLVNKFWDFKINYYNEMIQKFNLHQKAQMLIIHGAGDTSKELKDSEHEVYFVNIIRTSEQVSDNYDLNLLFDDTFETEVFKLCNVLVGEKEIIVND